MYSILFGTYLNKIKLDDNVFKTYFSIFQNLSYIDLE